jgi:cytochrome b involved in lipid metabolism
MGQGGSRLRSFTVCEVHKHNNKTDGYWLYDDKYVYDVTPFFFDRIHPGGQQSILNRIDIRCSIQTDISYHSRNAKKQLATMIVGRLRDCKNCECAASAGR